MEPDLSEFHNLTRAHPANLRTCSVGRARRQLTDDQREQVDAALATGREDISASAIVEWFKARGMAVTRSGVGSHRKGNCQCARDADGA